ncbi:MAG: signal peptidase II [Phycisphaerales bacterium]|nr:signal peptidase II [Phycisphaerales bacterium]
MSDAAPARRPAYSSPRAWAILVSVLVLGLAADMVSKSLAFRFIADRPVVVDRHAVLETTDLSSLIPPHGARTVIPGILDLSLVLNRGAVFGIGAGQRVFFIVFTLAALIFAGWMFAQWTREGEHLAHISIALLMAGGLGNLYDRLVFACVRDFLHPLPGVLLPFGWHFPGGGREVWPYVSNVADLWLIVGIAGLMWYLWRHGRTPRPAGPHPA